MHSFKYRLISIFVDGITLGFEVSDTMLIL